MDDLLPWLRLQYTPGLGRAGLFRLIDCFGSAALALDKAATGWPRMPGLRDGLAATVPTADSLEVQSAYSRLQQCDGWLCTFWDSDYPALLRDIPDPPALLYGRGHWPDAKALAIVGARVPTDVGRHFTESLAESLASLGLVIVSGLARGIDTAAHHGALVAGGRTIAVLGCGVDRVYPQENKRLYQQIAEQGTLISEYPPGSEPLAGHFPGRNRIISGLSKGVLVVEAARDSGSLITAEFALEQGREVMAVPGGIDRKTSYGPNLLIKQGAHPVTEVADVLSILDLEQAPPSAHRQRRLLPSQLSQEEQKLLGQLSLTPRCSDELAGECGLTPREVSVILLHLELQGYAEKQPGGRYLRGRREL